MTQSDPRRRPVTELLSSTPWASALRVFHDATILAETLLKLNISTCIIYQLRAAGSYWGA